MNSLDSPGSRDFKFNVCFRAVLKGISDIRVINTLKMSLNKVRLLK
jgi:hypothetical protein